MVVHVPTDQTRSSDRDNAWFLSRGLPLVLATRDRSHRLLPRSMPLVAAFTVFGLIGNVVLTSLNVSEEALDRRFTNAVWLNSYLALLCSLVIGPIIAALVVRRLARGRFETVTCVVVLGFTLVVLPIVDSTTGAAVEDLFGSGGVGLTLMLCALVVVGTYLGLGSVLGWSARFAMSRLSAIEMLGGRLLPLLMITMVIFFTGELWQWAAAARRPQVWTTIGLLTLVALAFIVVSTRDEVEEAIARSRQRGDDLLTGTPFAGRPESTDVQPLTRGEHLNVQVQLILAQVIQAALVTLLTLFFFLVLGAVMIPDHVVEQWSGTAAAMTDGTWFGIRVPIPKALLHMALFVAFLSGLNFTVSSSTDSAYRQRFLDPLVDDVAVSLAARSRYARRCGPVDDDEAA